MKDNQKRGRMGVVASVVKRSHGRVRLVFDDLERSASDWRTLGLYTWKDMSQRVFRRLRLTDKQLAEVREKHHPFTLEGDSGGAEPLPKSIEEIPDVDDPISEPMIENVTRLREPGDGSATWAGSFGQHHQLYRHAG